MVRATQGRLSALSVSLCKSGLYGAFVWARRALNRRPFTAVSGPGSGVPARHPGGELERDRAARAPRGAERDVRSRLPGALHGVEQRADGGRGPGR